MNDDQLRALRQRIREGASISDAAPVGPVRRWCERSGVDTDAVGQALARLEELQKQALARAGRMRPAYGQAVTSNAGMVWFVRAMAGRELLRLLRSATSRTWLPAGAKPPHAPGDSAMEQGVSRPLSFVRSPDGHGGRRRRQTFEEHLADLVEPGAGGMGDVMGMSQRPTRSIPGRHYHGYAGGQASPSRTRRERVASRLARRPPGGPAWTRTLLPPVL